MWEKVSALVAVILLVGTVVGAYYSLEGRISSLEKANLVKWKESIEEYQKSSEQEQCIDEIKLTYNMSHDHNEKKWCPDHYFLTQINLDGAATEADKTKGPFNYPIIGSVTCCRALPPPVPPDAKGHRP